MHETLRGVEKSQDVAFTAQGVVRTLDSGAVVVSPWMDSEEAAAFLGMNHSEFKTRAAKGEILRHEQRPNRYRYHASELNDWLWRR